MTSLFDYVKATYNTYPELLGYNYLRDHPDNLNEYEYVFIASDYSVPLNTTACQMMMSAEQPGTFMWINDDFSHIRQLPHAEEFDVPTVGFVGRIPHIGGVLHRGFRPRLDSTRALLSSAEICFDAHIRVEPVGDSCGFYNPSHPDYKRHEPLFKTNMLANVYQLCARGNANWSLRFFEALAYGRIPVYIESGGRLPWDHVIDYFEDCPLVYVKDIKNIEANILQFHQTHDLSDAQDRCRYMYEDYFTQEAQIRLFDEYPPGRRS